MLNLSGFRLIHKKPALKPRQAVGRLIGESPKQQGERVRRETLGALSAKKPVTVLDIYNSTSGSQAGIRGVLNKLVDEGVATSKKVKLPTHTKPTLVYRLVA